MAEPRYASGEEPRWRDIVTHTGNDFEGEATLVKVYSDALAMVRQETPNEIIGCTVFINSLNLIRRAEPAANG